MANVFEVLALWEAVDVSVISQEVIEENADAIIGMNQMQMQMGQNANGGKIGWYRNKAYAELKHSMNPLPPFRVPDLHLTGAFYSGMKIHLIGADSVEITSDDEKTQGLIAKYGGEIFGLQDAGVEAINEDVLMPEFCKKFRERVKQ
jgi:hypothetical protein